MNQNSADTVRYVDTANTSQISGLRKFCHRFMSVLGTGNSQYAARHGRPVWNSGKMPAHITANSVMASAERLMDVRHFCRNKNRIAEISVPAWPMPIQKTKFVMSQAQPTGRLLPHTPIPVDTRYVSIAPSSNTIELVHASVIQYFVGVLKTGTSTTELMRSLMSWRSCPPCISGGFTSSS